MDEPSPRELFPRGLIQPPDGFRFSLDALLLAAFAAHPQGGRVADLGAGCGVVGLAMLLKDDTLEAVSALEADTALVRAARENAGLLGESYRFQAYEADVREIRRDAKWQPEGFQRVVSNPPYRKAGQGRAPATKRREAALFESETSLAHFVDAASYLLRNKSPFFLVYDAERLDDVLAELLARKLRPKRLVCVHSRRDERARLVLVEAMKNGGAGLRVEPPLFLYSGEGRDTELTARALEFCPFLACNPRPGGGGQGDSPSE